ncbi:glutathione S-transferase family protein [Sedimentitalea sp. JM2-8]|uniref:Glutathione S-transferase family protein n=1 Tax=Sedimentitalea xiamensis TaxID=3050037 RepID=A0ABT7F9Q0_9RHOB|nr:glutathione S-transferase family protein [Sedimentitalea xiamensis]MDK3071820.1 glutathione S-transferase family protein [Sedimentitalea xiamensis]
MTLKLWHCKDARSFRPLWALEEMGLDYALEILAFPPRALRKDYFDVNPLGTVPFLRDGETGMTESAAICQYLADRYAPEFGVDKDHPEYGAYLNWLHQSDATFTFPQALMLRYGVFAPEDKKLPRVVEDYRAWYLGRLRWLDAHLERHEWLVADRFTVADIAVGYAVYLGGFTGAAEDYTPQTRAYLDRLLARDGFKRALMRQKDAPGF